MAHDNVSTVNPYDSDATCAMGLADFAALDLDPTTAPAPDAALLKLDAADLRALLPLASEDPTRCNLNAIHVEIDGIKREITMVATDGHCMGVITRSQADMEGIEHFDGRSFTLKRDAIENACKVAGRGKKACPVYVEVFTDKSRSTSILVGQTRITACEETMTFPAWRQVLPRAELGEKPAQVALNLAIVARFVAMGELSGKGYGTKITIRDSLSPVRLDFAIGVCGVVMPMRL